VENREEYRDKIVALKSKYKEDYRHLFDNLGLAI
jgi:hypothetical protein